MQRPTQPVEALLMQLEAERADADVPLVISDVIVGSLSVRDGVVTHAELPGAEGDRALAMLPELFGVRGRLEPPSCERRTVGAGWRSFYEEGDRRLCPPSAGCFILEVAKPVEAAVALEARLRRSFPIANGS